MKKKLILFAGVLVLALGLCSCGSSDEKDYSTDADLQSSIQSSAQVLGSITAEEAASAAETYASYDGYEIYAEAFSEWADIADEVGDYIGLKDYTVTKSGKTVTAIQIFECTNRDVKLTYVLSTITDEITSINVEIVYSTAETMAKAALNTVMGISVVFCVLVLISLVIYSFRLIPLIQEKFTKKDTPESVKAVESEAIAAAVGTTAGASDSLELIAVITAAIAASTGAATDSFVVRSIKRR